MKQEFKILIIDDEKDYCDVLAMFSHCIAIL